MNNFIDMDLANLILPTSFEDALTYEQQVIWLCLHKQDILTAGENITMEENEDGTVTISAGDSTYRIDEVEPESGYTAAYALIDVKTGEQMGETIQIPTVAGPEGPEGPQGEDGVGIDSIEFKEEDEDGNYVYTVTLTDETEYDITSPIGPEGSEGPQGPQGIQGETGPQGPQGIQGVTGPQGATGPQGPAGQGVPTGGTAGQVLAKRSGTDYDTEWVTPSSGGGSGMDLRSISQMTASSGEDYWTIEGESLIPIISSNFDASVEYGSLRILEKIWQDADGLFATRETTDRRLSLKVKLESLGSGSPIVINNDAIVFSIVTNTVSIGDVQGDHGTTTPFLNGYTASRYAYIMFISSTQQFLVPARITFTYRASKVTIRAYADLSSYITSMAIPDGNYAMLIGTDEPPLA